MFSAGLAASVPGPRQSTHTHVGHRTDQPAATSSPERLLRRRPALLGELRRVSAELLLLLRVDLPDPATVALPPDPRMSQVCELALDGLSEHTLASVNVGTVVAGPSAREQRLAGGTLVDDVVPGLRERVGPELDVSRQSVARFPGAR